jgi:hypothetical protein
MSYATSMFLMFIQVDRHFCTFKYIWNIGSQNIRNGYNHGMLITLSLMKTYFEKYCNVSALTSRSTKYNFIRDWLTIEHMNENAGWFGCGWCTCVIAWIGWQRSTDQKTRCSRLLFRHDANATSLAIIYHVVAFIPVKLSKIT